MAKTNSYQHIVFALLLCIFIGCTNRVIRGNSLSYQPREYDGYKPNPRIPLQIDHYDHPKLVRLETGLWLTYELHLTNFFTASIVIDQLVVYGDTIVTQPLRRLSGNELKQNFKALSGAADTIVMLRPGERGILYLWVKVPAATSTPKCLYHQLLVQINKQKMLLAIPPLSVGKTPLITIAAPLKGTWMAGQGVDPEATSTEGHNRLRYPTNGQIRLPQRFATDWIKLGEDKRVFRGDLTKNENYYSYGAEVYAVADGEITSVQDDIPENVPPDMTVPRTQKNIAGNYIVMKIAGGLSVFYGHLQTGSILVKKGDRVKRGSTLAKVGNTGNSTCPHLHFQVTEGDDFTGEGFPYIFRQFTKYAKATKTEIDTMADHGTVYDKTLTSHPLSRVLPVYGDIVRFNP